MIDLAQASLDAYDIPTIKVGNAAALIKEIDGRLVIAYAGTNGIWDGIDDILAFPWKPKKLNQWAHFGMWRYFNRTLDRVLSELCSNSLPVVFTGHSLGGAAAVYGAALWLHYGFEVDELTTFGCPSCCGDGIIELIKDIPGHRVVREGDQVTMISPWSHAREATMIAGADGFIDHPMDGYRDQLIKTPV